MNERQDQQQSSSPFKNIRTRTRDPIRTLNIHLTVELFERLNKVCDLFGVTKRDIVSALIFTEIDPNEPSTLDRLEGKLEEYERAGRQARRNMTELSRA